MAGNPSLYDALHYPNNRGGWQTKSPARERSFNALARALNALN
jgi:hypothetical protein